MKKILVVLAFIGLVSCENTQSDAFAIESVQFTRSCQDTCTVDSCTHKLDTLKIQE